MAFKFQNAFILGIERVAAWADVLDDINVFPVADGDTGRNLIISLAPLRHLKRDPQETIHRLLLSARGNSGNIANQFFAGFLAAGSFESLSLPVKAGRDRAWQAVFDPMPGTMLTVFDALVEFLETREFEKNREYVSTMIDHLERAVRATHERLPRLKQAGVVDSGALGIYIFFEGFFKSLGSQTDAFRPIAAIFRELLEVSSSFQEEMKEGHCVDTVIRLDARAEEKIGRLSEYGESVVVIPHQGYYKVHLHTPNQEVARQQMGSLGDIVNWSDDDLGVQIKKFKQHPVQGAIHIMTDAAGSVTRDDSRDLDITLLDSYINAGDRSLPETLFSPSELYAFMRNGRKVSTSQASVFERHQIYQRIVEQYKKTLYLCVGSVFTGNYDVVMMWKKNNDPEHRLTVIDTAAASGRLGVIVIATARYSLKIDDADKVIAFAKRAVDQCREYVFLDKLKYLAAGGRLSRSGAFFGDMLHVKPVISPTAEGAKKVGAVKNQDGQLEFALQKLDAAFKTDSSPFIMLEYSDNRSWVQDTVKKTIEKSYPASEVLLRPLSLTSGVHMGPGTWAMAFLPERV